MKKIHMKGRNACMPIIGKIIEESHLFLLIQKNCVKTGRQRNSYQFIQKDASNNINAHIAMDGRNKNYIQNIIRQGRVIMDQNVQNPIVRSIIMKNRNEDQCQHGSKYFQKQEE